MTEPTACVVLFDGVELLDVAGPVELLTLAGVGVVAAGSDVGPVATSQGLTLTTTCSLEDAPDPDVLLVPGGMGTRRLVDDPEFLARLRPLADRSALVASVCTGSALLAAAGLLDGHRATSNKRAFEWVRSVRPEVEWVPVARWVRDRDRWTSSGVAAGMDMAHALITELVGAEAADRAAVLAELEIHRDPDRDPFAGYYGLDG